LSLVDLLNDSIRERGPLTVAAFMDLALYHPTLGYYARAAQRSGRAGDFFTSVDVGAIFGDLLEIQIAEMAALLAGRISSHPHHPFELIEAGAGNGRLSADILRAVRHRHPALYEGMALHLVEASAAARAAQRVTLGDAASKLASSGATLPSSFEGVLLANELLDAMPVHLVVMRAEGLREVYVHTAANARAATGPRFVAREGPPSTPALAEYLRQVEATLEEGWRAEISLRALDWIRDAAARLRRGFIILIDYGHEARDLFSVSHAAGTLASFAGHTMDSEPGAAEPWLARPGMQDISAHVDFTGIRRAAETEGLVTLGFLDQTYFLMGLMGPDPSAFLNDLNESQRRAIKTLLMPGGLGSTMKVLILGKTVGTPHLAGCSYRERVT
jgi:SAM-dependent MidA family methyltransferase